MNKQTAQLKAYRLSIDTKTPHAYVCCAFDSVDWEFGCYEDDSYFFKPEFDNKEIWLLDVAKDSWECLWEKPAESVLLATKLLKASIENFEAAVKEKGFSVGVRVKCKTSSMYNAKGFITAASNDEMFIAWEDDNGKPIKHIPTKARKVGGKWYISDVGIFDEIKLWGVM